MIESPASWLGSNGRYEKARNGYTPGTPVFQVFGNTRRNGRPLAMAADALSGCFREMALALALIEGGRCLSAT